MNRKPARRSLFFDDWQACLRAHYVHVIRANDLVTEPTLRQVLLQSGLDEDDLEVLRQQAYASDDDAPESDLEAQPEYEEVPVENSPPEPGTEETPAGEPGAVYDDLGSVIETGMEIDDEGPSAEDEPADDEPPPEDESPPDYGRQLSLF